MPMPKNLEGKAVSIMNQPNRGKGAGRKPKVLKNWIKQCNLDKQDAREILKNILLLTPKEIDDRIKTDYSKLPAQFYIFLNNVQEAIKQQNIRVTRELMDFAYGNEPLVNITNNTQMVDLKALIINQAKSSPEEGERIIAELEKITGYTE